MISIVELAGIEFDQKNPVDGRSFAPLLFEEDTSVWEDRYFYTHQSRWDSLEMFPASIRNNRHRAVRYEEAWELYDMQDDPGQRKNIAKSNPEIVEQFSTAYHAWFAEVTQNLPEKRIIPIGYRESPNTTLSAVESEFEGNVRFFGGSGWSNDWLTGWENTSDKAWWNIKVVETGTFGIKLKYVVDREIEIKIGLKTESDRVLSNTIPAFEIVEIPSPDRIVRGEVYERKWGQFSLGEVQLEEGEQIIEFSIGENDAKRSGFEFKSLIITRIN